MHPTTEAGWLAGDIQRKTTPVSGVRAPCARVRRSRAVFRLPADELINSAAKNPNDTEWDEYYGYGIVNPYDVYKRADYAFASGMFDHTHTEGVTWKGKTETDLGPGIMDLDWRNISDDDLDLYLRDTHYEIGRAHV